MFSFSVCQQVLNSGLIQLRAPLVTYWRLGRADFSLFTLLSLGRQMLAHRPFAMHPLHSKLYPCFWINNFKTLHSLHFKIMSPLFGSSVLNVKLQTFLYAIVSSNKMFIVGQQFIIYFSENIIVIYLNATTKNFWNFKYPHSTVKFGDACLKALWLLYVPPV